VSEATKCYFAMRYWNPYTEEVLAKVRERERE
jgi:protoheme ferro-lyase